MQALAEAGIPRSEAHLEALILLAQAQGKDKAWVLAHPEHRPSVAECERYRAWLRRRMQREPLAYIVGEKAFFGRRFLVGPAVLIPRPETECVVEAALGCIRAHRAPRVLDLGTGSGCIAITIACARPDAEVWAVDVSRAALALARANARRHGAQVRFLRGHWYAALPEDTPPFDLIVSNPPYVAESERTQLAPELGYEPDAALYAGPDPHAALRAVLEGAVDWLAPQGACVVECGVHGLLPPPRGLVLVEEVRDLAGLVRGGIYRRC